MSFLACQTALQNDQACFPAEVTAAQLTARLCSISQENFGTSLTLNSEADVAASIGGMCWREIQGCFYAGADTDKGTGSFSCFSPLQKNSQVFFFFAPQTAVCFRSYQRNKSFQQRRDAKHRSAIKVAKGRCRADKFTPFELYSVSSSDSKPCEGSSGFAMFFIKEILW